MENNNFVDSCKLLGSYNDKNVYLYISSKYNNKRIFYSPDYFMLPKWADAETLTLFQAIKIIEFRLKNRNPDFIPNNIKKMIEETKTEA